MQAAYDAFNADREPPSTDVVGDAVRAAHDPARGLDRSVCLRDVLTVILRADPQVVESMGHDAADSLCWYLRKEFGVDAR
jgi:hypothetical protein